MPHKRRFVLGRFIFFFGGLSLFFLVLVGLISSLVFGSLHETLPPTAMVLLLVCVAPILFTLLVGALGGWTFRRFGRPMVEVMAAADAVADGDLSVRVSEQAPGEMGRLARSFNRMTAELERTAQQRRNLTADVAHELRTPLHILQGSLEGLQDGVYQPTPEFIDSMLDETRLLRRLVGDLQTLSLAEAGQLPLHKRLISAADLLSDAVTGFAAQASAAGVTLDFTVKGSPAEQEIEVDPDRMGQVLNNLIANALRHTPSDGFIHLQAEPVTAGFRISVQDSGSGIAPEDLPYVFDRFWKGDRARSRQAESGSGLGLAIASQLVQLHSGKIEVESQPGAGTTFTITLSAPSP